MRIAQDHSEIELLNGQASVAEPFFAGQVEASCAREDHSSPCTPAFSSLPFVVVAFHWAQGSSFWRLAWIFSSFWSSGSFLARPFSSFPTFIGDSGGWASEEPNRCKLWPSLRCTFCLWLPQGRTRVYYFHLKPSFNFLFARSKAVSLHFDFPLKNSCRLALQIRRFRTERRCFKLNYDQNHGPQHCFETPWEEAWHSNVDTEASSSSEFRIRWSHSSNSKNKWCFTKIRRVKNYVPDIQMMEMLRRLKIMIVRIPKIELIWMKRMKT